MSRLYLLAIIFALIAGGAMAIQPGANGTLAKRMAHPLQASALSFGTGFCILLLVCLAMRVPLPTWERMQTVPWWAWTGGLLGTFMVTTSLLFAPKIGAANWFCLVISSQIILSLVLDHFGWAGYPIHSVNWMRVLGAAALVAGVVLVCRN